MLFAWASLRTNVYVLKLPRVIGIAPESARFGMPGWNTSTPIPSVGPVPVARALNRPPWTAEGVGAGGVGGGPRGGRRPRPRDDLAVRPHLHRRGQNPCVRLDGEVVGEGLDARAGRGSRDAREGGRDAAPGPPAAAERVPCLPRVQLDRRLGGDRGVERPVLVLRLEDDPVVERPVVVEVQVDREVDDVVVELACDERAVPEVREGGQEDPGQGVVSELRGPEPAGTHAEPRAAGSKGRGGGA